MTYKQICYQTFFAILGAFWGFILFLGASLVYFFRRVLDPYGSTGIHTFLLAIVVASFILSLVLALHGRRKGKRIAGEPSESGNAQTSPARDPEGTILYLIVGVIWLILVLIFFQTMVMFYE